ncbi:MAG: SpoIID/LytB domain-containing protein, partial [Planctomycetes bacterium]|nr:SpoIID/LytB domain-containing protein [Planctomycetota bacterium]
MDTRASRLGLGAVCAALVLVSALGSCRGSPPGRGAPGPLAAPFPIRSAVAHSSDAVVVPLEDYLAGVLGGEVPLSWPADALRAQAVAARTYAVHQALARRAAPYDVTADTRSQVWRPGLAGDPRAVAAVRETAALVLAWGGSPLAAYYHSTCGGHTAAGGTVFDEGAAIPPLAGVPCEDCRGSAYYRWVGVRVEASELAAALASLGLPLAGTPTAVDPLETGPDGRATRVRVASDRGEVDLPGTALRRALGPERLRSTRFRARREGASAFVFEGGGWGHGVGLC